METGTQPGYLKNRLDRCREDLRWASEAVERGEYRLSLNRAYYAVFHLASAVLALLGDTRRKHSGVEAAFNELLVKPGHLEAEYAKFYREARRWREDADYGFGVEYTETTARDVLAKAERLVERLERFLRERGHLPPEPPQGQTEEQPK